MQVNNNPTLEAMRARSDMDARSDFLKGAEGSMSSQNKQQVSGMIAQIFKALLSLFTKG